MELVLKTSDPARDREFESHTLRHTPEPIPGLGLFSAEEDPYEMAFPILSGNIRLQSL